MKRLRTGGEILQVKKFFLPVFTAILCLLIVSQLCWQREGYTDMLIKREERCNSGMYERRHLYMRNSAYKSLHFLAKSLSSYAYVEENYDAFIKGEEREYEGMALLSYMIGQNAKNRNDTRLTDNSIFGEAYIEKEEETNETEQKSSLEESQAKVKLLYEKQDYETLIKNFYIVDSSTKAVKKVFDAKKLLEMKLKIEPSDKPQILIYHTHGASESFADSKKGDKAESVVGVGAYLAKILEEEYGYKVIHDDTEYDRVNGKIDRNKAYNQSLDAVEKWLKKYPSIQVTIDLHRDGVGQKVVRTTTIDGKKTAQVMFFNGLSRTKKGKIDYLYNENLQANLAFSLQCKLAAMQKYPDFTKPIYLKSYRYNLHVRERSMLIELGNENNTLQEAKNAMLPLADVLNQVLSKDSSL